MVKWFISLSLLCVLVAESFTQEVKYGFPSEGWHKGTVFLNDGKELSGIIKYDLESDLIHLKLNEQKQILAANQFARFSIFQRDIKKQREFISIPFVNKTGYKRPKLFEAIHYSGRGIALLGREFLHISSGVRRDQPARMKFRWGRPQIESVKYEFYLLREKNEVVLLRGGRKSIANAFGQYQEELKKFIKKNRLETDLLEDIVRLVEYYNSLRNK